ncbi:acid-sensing ion channel 1A-like [Glandiceps talaboti]
MVERLLQDMYSFNQTTIYAEGLDWMKYNDSTNEITNITDFGLVAAHKIEDILVQCQWSTHSTCHPENFTTIFADFGVCYTFNGDADNPLFVHNRGRIYGLYMILDLQQHEYFYGSHRGAGIKMLVHSATDPPLIGELGMALGPGMDATVALTTSRVERTNCKDESLDYYKHYSGANCELAKRTNSVLATCGCRAPYMPGDERLCTLEEEVTCLPNVLGKHDYFCPAPCDATIYHATLSFASFPGEHVLQKISETYNKSEDEIWKNFIAVSIYMEDLSVFMTKQEIAYTIDNFLGDMGGQLGLCLGASILTMWEFGEFVLTLLCYRCRGLFKMMKGERKK